MPLYQKIPLLPQTTDQTVSVEIDDTSYILRVLWNERFGYFALTVSTADDVPIVSNIKMVKNYPLVGKFKDTLLPFGDFFFVQESGSIDRPGYDDLGVSFFLYYYEPDVVASTAPVIVEPIGAVLGSLWDSGFTDWDDGASGWDT